MSGDKSISSADFVAMIDGLIGEMTAEETEFLDNGGLTGSASRRLLLSLAYSLAQGHR